MTIQQNETGDWDVKDSAGETVATLATNEAGWRWVDRNEDHPTYLTHKTAAVPPPGTGQ